MSFPNKFRITEKTLAILIVFLGFSLRLLMLLSGKSLWGDEWFSIDLAQKSLQETFIGALRDVHPPLYFVGLHLLIQSLGFHEWVFRLISFVAGVGTVYLVYLLGTKITGNRRIGLWAAFLVAVSPYFLQVSNEIRSYSLLGFVSCLGTFLFLRLLDGKNTWVAKLWYLLIAVSVPYVEHYGWFWLFGISVYLVYLYASKRIVDKSLFWLQVLVIFLCLPSFGLIAYQALYSEPVFDAARVSPYYSLSAMLKKGTAVFWHFACGPNFSMLSSERVLYYASHSAGFWFSFALTLGLFSLSLKSLAGFVRKRMDIFILFLFLLFFPIVCLLILYPIRLHSRYLTFAAPYFFILIANVLAKEQHKKWLSIFLLIVAGTYLYTDYNFIKLKTDPLHREDYPAMIQYAFEKAGPNDAICGFLVGQEVVSYYDRRLKLPKNAAYFDTCFKLAKDPSVKKYNKIWLMGYMDMDENTNIKNMAYFKQAFGRAGFNAMSRHRRFGGENSLTSVYVFEKN